MNNIFSKAVSTSQKGGDLISRAALLSILLLAGCTTVEKIPAELCKPLPKLDPHIPTPVTLNVPEFYVVSNDNRATFDKRIQEDSNGVFYATTPEGYIILSENMQELRRYIRELQQVVLFYDKSIAEHTTEPSTGDSPKQ